MKKRYSIVHDAQNTSIADVALADPGRCLYDIIIIYVAEGFRGRGYGRELLRRIIEDADREGVQLRLEVSALSTDMDNADLYAWYGRYGFARNSKYDIMDRVPLGAAVAA